MLSISFTSFPFPPAHFTKGFNSGFVFSLRTCFCQRGFRYRAVNPLYCRRHCSLLCFFGGIKIAACRRGKPRPIFACNIVVPRNSIVLLYSKMQIIATILKKFKVNPSGSAPVWDNHKNSGYALHTRCFCGDPFEVKGEQFTSSNVTVLLWPL